MVRDVELSRDRAQQINKKESIGNTGGAEGESAGRAERDAGERKGQTDQHEGKGAERETRGGGLRPSPLRSASSLLSLPPFLFSVRTPQFGVLETRARPSSTDAKNSRCRMASKSQENSPKKKSSSRD